jgi:hypothetical protein
MGSYGGSPYGGNSYSGYSQPSYQSPTSSPASSSGRTASPSGGAGSQTPKDNLSTDKEKKLEQESAKTGDKESKPEGNKTGKTAFSTRSTPDRGRSQSAKKEEKPENETIIKLFAKLEGSFDDLDERYEQHAMLSSIKNDALSEEMPDFEFLEEGLKELISKLKNAKKIVGQIAEEIKDYDQADKARIKTSVEKMLQKQAEHLDNTAKEIKDLEDNKATLAITPIKRFFYLGDESQKDAVVAATPEEFHQFIDRQYLKIQNNNALTLTSLAQAWKDLNDTFKADFNKLLPSRRRRRQ